MWVFSTFGEQGLLFSAVHRVLTAVLVLLWSTGSSLVVASGAYSPSAVQGLLIVVASAIAEPGS